MDLFPITPLGLFVSGAAGLALHYYAFARLDLVFLVLGYGALGLSLLSLVGMLIGALVVWIRLRRPSPAEPLRLETGRSTPTGFETGSLRWLPLVQMRWEWEQPGGFLVRAEPLAGRVHETIVATERGHHQGLRRRVIVQDAFGLARMALRFDDPRELEVVPHLGALGRMPPLISLSGGDERPHPMGIDDGDRTEMRRYVPGDPARFIHWKAFSRTRKLIVRMPERALSRARRTVAYLVAGPDDESSAAAARAALGSGIFAEQWVFGADGSAAVASRLEEALPLIVRSRSERERGGRGLEPFLMQAERTGPASAILFVPPVPGPWLEKVCASLAHRRDRSRVVIGVDGLAPEPRGGLRALLTRLLIRAERPEASSPEALEQVLDALAATRVEVTVLDRVTGKALGPAHRAAIRAARARPAGARTRGRAA
ncbi:MAG: DUF58 domain-containing protein [Myxococcales bacterium]|nr:DUF58 domain-containing protein [Myxococcales bacterium]